MEELRDFLHKIDIEMKEPDAQIFKLHYKRNRYIYELRRQNKLTNESYYKLVKDHKADHNLICMWRKPGYETVCCLRCIQPVDHKYNNVCKCRLPEKMNIERTPCADCGCTGCSSFSRFE